MFDAYTIINIALLVIILYNYNLTRLENERLCFLLHKLVYLTKLLLYLNFELSSLKLMRKCWINICWTVIGYWLIRRTDVPSEIHYDYKYLYIFELFLQLHYFLFSFPQCKLSYNLWSLRFYTIIINSQILILMHTLHTMWKNFSELKKKLMLNKLSKLS